MRDNICFSPSLTSWIEIFLPWLFLIKYFPLLTSSSCKRNGIPMFLSSLLRYSINFPYRDTFLFIASLSLIFSDIKISYSLLFSTQFSTFSTLSFKLPSFNSFRTPWATLFFSYSSILLTYLWYFFFSSAMVARIASRAERISSYPSLYFLEISASFWQLIDVSGEFNFIPNNSPNTPHISSAPRLIDTFSSMPLFWASSKRRV